MATKRLSMEATSLIAFRKTLHVLTEKVLVEVIYSI